LKGNHTQDLSLMSELQIKIGDYRSNLLASASEVEN
jgi:hypothetical protein